MTVAAAMCVIDGCPRRNWARGLCSNHYQQHRYRGTLNQFPLNGAPTVQGIKRASAVPPHPNAEANPWAGQRPCPGCGTADWSMPFAPGDLPDWRCVDCHLTFIPKETQLVEDTS